MPTDAENLATYRSAILTELAGITLTKSYSIDGQAVDHNAYRQSLLKELREIDAVMAGVSGPFSVEVIGEP